jgi:hypothetical protein
MSLFVGENTVMLTVIFFQAPASLLLKPSLDLIAVL